MVQIIDWDSELVLTNDYYRAARAWREEFTSSEAEREYFTRSSEEDAREYAYNNVWLYVRWHMQKTAAYWRDQSQ